MVSIKWRTLTSQVKSFKYYTHPLAPPHTIDTTAHCYCVTGYSMYLLTKNSHCLYQSFEVMKMSSLLTTPSSKHLRKASPTSPSLP